MKQHLYKLTLLIIVLSVFVCGRAQAQSTNDWFRRQQQQQQIQRQQQEQQRQQQQRQQMQDQMRQQQQQMRQQMQERMRQQAQERMRQQQSGVGRGSVNGPARSGVMNNRSGYIGKTSQDGRPLAMINGRVLAVPQMRAALSSRGYRTGPSQTSRWTNSQRATISAQLQTLATSNLKQRVRSGGPGGLKEKFNSAAGNGGDSSGGNGGPSGGNGGGGNRRGAGGNGSGPKKGDLTRKFNEAAGVKPKKNPDKPTPELKPKASPTPNGPRP